MICRYGSEHSLNSKDILEKYKNTVLDKYGVNHAMKNDNIKTKLKKTNLEKISIFTL